ncbi:PucR family transcriptional regulator [Pseudonocardia bannensis]|uniref:PucR C-terminal helix-turn-helix domain-containing protein n=1 Tax=Pseudonocardia bannensis TaxID=630973 RepID=A0A848DL42_9PSEU|nr:helix-turn-helix domain-containing protein [Pseudonocardia bannensis]NMH93259.1 hypothetical protein [Pseudonocardia bannensis]
MSEPVDPDALRRIAETLLPRRDRFIDELVEATKQEIPALNHDDRLHGLLHASIAENTTLLVEMLRDGADPQATRAPAGALGYARRLAQSDVSLSALLRAYRIGQARFTTLCLQVAARPELAGGMPSLTVLVDGVATFIDRVCEDVAKAYEQERERWVSTRSGLRQHWVSRLLAGSVQEVQRAEAVLEYRLDATHLAVEVWIDDPLAPDEALNVFVRTEHVLRGAVSSRSDGLVVPTGDREVRMWFAVDPDRNVDAAVIAEALRRARLPGRVALGAPATGVDGFRRTHRLAARTKLLALSAGRPDSKVLLFEQVAPVALLAAGDEVEIRAFVAATLGTLGVDDTRRAGLRETLQVFLESNRSYARTAQVMMLHRNTVHYRVQQAAKECRRSFDDSPLDVLLALAACRWLGEAVLAPADSAPVSPRTAPLVRHRSGR